MLRHREAEKGAKLVTTAGAEKLGERHDRGRCIMRSVIVCARRV